MSTQLENRPIIKKGVKYKRAPRNTGALMFPKQDMYRNQKLLDLAKGMPCTLLITAGPHDPEHSVSCHSNSSRHGKAKSQKAHDAYHAHGCAACHHELDFGKSLSRYAREMIMAWAMQRTRQNLIERGLIDIGKCDAVSLVTDDSYWLQCWRSGEIRVA
ncbi:nuclease domain-containing protein [Aquidulcibacter sp.]|uniref:nuclease domain-containing protein n=1 Tax=Aquidulcibacter sp. TaxID=2052990 RepID=UPI0025BD2889|nr:nuclease domain-containing protein [Aquidulcibacter sp.]MCA3064451.1 DUF1364 family protein [Rhodocyclaceae bacterium]MCA3694271.1 DUF1364 family protein [Aquidulcibacter sp.]